MNVIDWLLSGDVSIQYAVHKYLLHTKEEELLKLQECIAEEGFGKQFLDCRNETGHWGLHYYQPKWTSTHYTLLDLKHLELSPNHPMVQETIQRMFHECQLSDGGMNLSKSDLPSDLGVDGMVLTYIAYFCPHDPRINHLIDSILSKQRSDGGFDLIGAENIYMPFVTMCVLEGLGECILQKVDYRKDDLLHAEQSAISFFINHRFYIDDHDRRFRLLTYPSRYRYDLLRILEFLAQRGIPYQPAFDHLLEWLKAKQTKEGVWNLEFVHPGHVHFEMECTNKPSRIITWKALHALSFYHVIDLSQVL